VGFLLLGVGASRVVFELFAAFGLHTDGDSSGPAPTIGSSQGASHDPTAAVAAAAGAGTAAPAAGGPAAAAVTAPPESPARRHAFGALSGCAALASVGLVVLQGSNGYAANDQSRNDAFLAYGRQLVRSAVLSSCCCCCCSKSSYYFERL